MVERGCGAIILCFSAFVVAQWWAKGGGDSGAGWVISNCQRRLTCVTLFRLVSPGQGYCRVARTIKISV